VTARALPAGGSALARFHVLFDGPSPLLKQVPTLVALGLAVLLIVTIPELGFTTLVSALLGIGAVLAASVLALVLTVRHVADGPVVLLIPIVDILGLGLFRAGTGGPGSLFAGLILIPIVWLAAAPGVRYVALVAVLTSFVLLLPYFSDPPETGVEWLRGVISPIVFAIVAGVVNELSRLQRQRAQLAERLAAEQSIALARNLEMVTQLQASEHRYRDLLGLFRSVWDATTAQGVIGVDMDGLVVAWNPGAVNLFGVREDEAAGRLRMEELFPDDALALLAQGAAEPAAGDPLPPGLRALFVLADGDTTVDRDLTLRGGAGQPLPVRLTVTPRRDGDGEQLGYLLVVTDETRTAEVSRMKDEFVGMISHELRTPLGSILGYIDLLLDDPENPLSEEQAHFLGVVQRNAERLLKLVGDLLFTAQVESGGFRLELQQVDVVPLLVASVESANPIAQAAGVELIAELPSEPVPLSIDPDRLGQAVDNIVSNAVKFTPSGGRVALSLSAGPAAVTISVRDSGIGIPKDELKRLFTRFFRASTATRNAVPGIGLGLVIARAIIVAHGGWMDVSSEEGVGTEFRLTLPLHHAESDDPSHDDAAD